MWISVINKYLYNIRNFDGYIKILIFPAIDNSILSKLPTNKHVKTHMSCNSLTSSGVYKGGIKKGICLTSFSSYLRTFYFLFKDKCNGDCQSWAGLLIPSLFNLILILFAFLKAAVIANFIKKINIFLQLTPNGSFILMIEIKSITGNLNFANHIF